uniref:Uncharacterized protein n=1 Tax=Aegilops tauschii subsp. strangulata TaxID=200361 RepID=A0A453CYU0_AEGTS
MAPALASRQEVLVLVRSLTYRFNHHCLNCCELHSDESDACISLILFIEPGQYSSTVLNTLSIRTAFSNYVHVFLRQLAVAQPAY